MATGYTAIIRGKPNVTFREYALRCSRGIGYLYQMKDDSLDAKIPDEIHPPDYHLRELKGAKKTLQSAKSMTLEQAAEEAKCEYQNCKKSHKEVLHSFADLRNRYESMLAEAKNWQPPTKNHEDLKEFMISQLEESLKWDCSYERVEEPQRQTPEQYKAQLIERAKTNIMYHQKKWKEVVKRAREATKWIQALKMALPEK